VPNHDRNESPFEGGIPRRSRPPTSVCGREETVVLTNEDSDRDGEWPSGTSVECCGDEQPDEELSLLFQPESKTPSNSSNPRPAVALEAKATLRSAISHLHLVEAP